MKEKSRAVVQNSGLVVSLDKSKRLAAMRQSQESRAIVDVKQKTFTGSKKEQGVQHARDLIRQRIAKLKSSYPVGKQTRFFTLRYASEEQINQMTLQQLFTLLKISKPLDKDIGGMLFENISREE